MLFRCPLLLGLPQMAGDGDGVHAGGHGFGWDLAELLPVRVVLIQSFNHLGRDAFGTDAGQSGHLLRLGAVCVDGPELASRVTEEHQEVIGLGFFHFLTKTVQNKTISKGIFKTNLNKFLRCIHTERDSRGRVSMLRQWNRCDMRRSEVLQRDLSDRRGAKVCQQLNLSNEVRIGGQNLNI